MGKVNVADVATLIDSQLKAWEMARNNYEALKNVEVKEMNIGDSTIKVQFNPARITSTAAKVDPKSLKERKCFLCDENRPDVQEGLKWGEEYTVLINPFPIFPKHLTIPSNNHVDQLIESRIGDMMEIAKDLDRYTIFYNGPKCGASAPDHMHFQAGNKGFLTCEADMAKSKKEEITSYDSANLYKVENLALPFFLIESTSVEAGKHLFASLYKALDIPEGEPEPMLNILCWYESDKWYVMVVPRKKHRPSCYFAEGDDQILLSPASVDMGGVFITPVEKDFKKITSADIKKMIDEVCLNSNEMNLIVNRIKNL